MFPIKTDKFWMLLASYYIKLGYSQERIEFIVDTLAETMTYNDPALAHFIKPDVQFEVITGSEYRKRAFNNPNHDYVPFNMDGKVMFASQADLDAAGIKPKMRI